MPTTVGDLSNLFEVSPQTIRKWCDEFADYLSPTATPPSGEVRIFTDEDLQVLVLVSQMRQALSSYEDIKQALSRGERGELPEQDLTEDADPGTALVIRYQAELEIRDRRIDELLEDRERWEERYEEEREARIEAERAAAAAETEVRLLRERENIMGGEEKDQEREARLEAERRAADAEEKLHELRERFHEHQQEQQAAPRRPWWQFWKR